MAIDLMPGFGAFTPAAGGLDGSESDGTNLYSGGNDFVSGSGWLFFEGGTVTNNATTAPDGTTTAALVVEDNGNNRHANILNFSAFSFTSGVDLTASWYAKKRERRYVHYNFESSGAGTEKICVIWDLDTLTVTDSEAGGTASVTSTNVQQGANGFVKCSVTFNAGTGITQGYHFIGMNDAATNNNASGAVPTYTGDNASGIWMWRFKVTQ
jgi:hypothetical protein